MVQPMVLVRPARHEDAAAIAEIYNQGIRGRGATFETKERTVEERAVPLEKLAHPISSPSCWFL